MNCCPLCFLCHSHSSYSGNLIKMGNLCNWCNFFSFFHDGADGCQTSRDRRHIQLWWSGWWTLTSLLLAPVTAAVSQGPVPWKIHLSIVFWKPHVWRAHQWTSQNETEEPHSVFVSSESGWSCWWTHILKANSGLKVNNSLLLCSRSQNDDNPPRQELMTFTCDHFILVLFQMWRRSNKASVSQEVTKNVLVEVVNRGLSLLFSGSLLHEVVCLSVVLTHARLWSPETDIKMWNVAAPIVPAIAL